MRRHPSAWSWAQRGILAALAAALLVFGLRANGNTAAEVTTRDTSVWLISPANGTIVQASERAHEVMATLRVGQAGKQQLAASQLRTGAVVLDRSQGTVGLVNGATLRYEHVVQLGTSRTDLALVTGGDQAYAVDTASGQLLALNPETLSTVASAEVTPQQATPAVVDDNGQLWALDVGHNQLVGLQHNGPTTRSKLATSDQTGQLGLVEGRPIVVEPGDGFVARIDPASGRTEGRWCLPDKVSGQVFVAGSHGSSEPLVYTLAADRGELFTTNLRTGGCVRLQLRSSEESNVAGSFGQPVAQAGLLFVPLPARGQVLVVDGIANQIERSIRALPTDRGHRFELFNNDGSVWFNDLEGPTAGVLDRDGVTFFIDKYRAGADKVGANGNGGNSVSVDTNGEPVDLDPDKGTVPKRSDSAEGTGVGTNGNRPGAGAGKAQAATAPKPLDSGAGAGPAEGGVPKIPTVQPSADPATLAVLPPGDPAALPKAAPSTGPSSVSAIPGTSTGPSATGPAPDRPNEPKPPSVTPDALVSNFKWEPGGPVDFTTVVTFTDTSIGKPTAWVWAFTAPDATSSTLSGPQAKRSFDKAGVWTVTLTVSGGGKVDTSLPATIVVRDPAENAAPTPDFSWSPSTPTAGSEISFSDHSRGKGITEWAWDFGDGATSNAQNPKKVYAKEGTYLVRLSVKNPFGTAKAEAKVTVAGKPEAIKPDFTFALRSASPGGVIRPGLDVEFRDTSTGNPSSWQWDFGDGTTGTGAAIVHQFRDGREYRVQLTVRNDRSAGQVTKSVLVEKAVAAPVARIAQPNGNTAVEVNQRLAFVSGTTGNVTHQSWDWGDGSARTDGASATKTWTKVGTYVVTLTADNEAGSSKATLVVTVTNSKPGPIIVGFRTEPGGTADTAARVGENVLFINRSSGEGTFAWDFGDGASSTADNPVHAYTSPGIYHARLQMTSGDRVASDVRDVFVKASDVDRPTADFTYAPTSPLSGTPITFTDHSTGTLASWSWTFGDGSTSNAQNPSKTYANAGNYPVTLTVTSRSGASDSKSLTIAVAPGKSAPPVATLNVRTAAADRTTGKPIVFEDTSAAPKPLTTPVFTFPTGAISPQAGQRSVQYVFANPGTYQVSMEVCWVEDPKNCGSATVSVDIAAAAEKPVAAFVASGAGVIPEPQPARILTGKPVVFTDASTGSGINSWSWTVAGQPQPNAPRITVPGFDRPGRVEVTLIVSNSAGASTPVTRTFEVLDAKLTARFTVTSPVALGVAAKFTDVSEGFITQWAWEFGDGATFATTSPAERSPDHSYAAPGTYRVTLRVSNASIGAESTFTGQVVVTATARPAPTIQAVLLASGAVLSGPTLSVATNAPVQFTETAGTGPGLSWTWSWGDGSADSNGQKATHTFSKNGSYTVKVTVTNSAGSSETSVTVAVAASSQRDLVAG